MNKLEIISAFLEKSGMRKVGTGLAIYAMNAFLLSQKMLENPGFVELSKWIILALFAGNALEHYVKSQVKKAEAMKDVPPAP